MKVKAVYLKRVEVEDDITNEELEKVNSEGMPTRFDYMADEIDNEQPLEFAYYVDVDEFNRTHCGHDIFMFKFNRTWFCVGFIMAFIVATLGFFYYHDIIAGIINYIMFWVIFSCTLATFDWLSYRHKRKKDEKK